MAHKNQQENREDRNVQAKEWNGMELKGNKKDWIRPLQRLCVCVLNFGIYGMDKAS